jgi:DNA-binding FadR family transcriptional regulator
MKWNDPADRRDMATEQLKNMIEAGRYKPNPALVAEAMLSRRSVRELLTASEPLSRADRNRRPALASRRVA